MNLIEILKKFNSEKKCIDYLEKLRWNGNKKCVHCASINIRYDKSESRYACNECHQKFTVKVGTIFDHTRYPLMAENLEGDEDEFRAYKAFDQFIERIAIDHSKGFSKGIVHINTIEGFWTIVKNSIRGQYISISRKYLPFYLVQAQYIYNRRNATHDLFEEFMRSAVSERKPFLYYKPIRKVNEIVYRQRTEGEMLGKMLLLC